MAPAAPLQLAHDVWTGPPPLDEAAVARLQELGVRIIVSVDALPSPDVVGARAFTCPLATTAFRLRFRRQCWWRGVIALGPFTFIATAAAATLLQSLGRLDQNQARSILLRCGTSMAYPGLWHSMRSAVPVTASTTT